MRTSKNVLMTTTAFALIGLTACGGGDPMATADGSDAGTTSESIIVGSADFPESQLLAKIYAEALRAEGIPVEEKPNVGSREVTVPALRDGSIDLMPEYSGALLQYLDKETEATSSQEVAEELGKNMPEGIIALEQSEAENKDVLTVKKETAERYSLTTIEDLAPVAQDLVLGGPPEWKTRYNGLAGLEAVYGLQFKSFSPLDAGGPLTLNALLSDQVQVADLFSTDPAIIENDLVTLEDNKNLFLAENIVPIGNEEKLTDSAEQVLNQVSAALTTEDLIEMNGRVAEFEDMGDIARDWLAEQNLS